LLGEQVHPASIPQVDRKPYYIHWLNAKGLCRDDWVVGKGECVVEAVLAFVMGKNGALDAECSKRVTEIALFEAAGDQVYGHMTDSSWPANLLQLGGSCVYSNGMKRWILCLLLCFGLPLFAAPLAVDLVGAYPNQLHLNWEAVSGCDYYDIYVDGKPVQRVRQTSVVLGSNEKPLESHRQYEVIVAARKTGNIDIAAAKQSYSTTGWEGRYRWINLTDKDNKGKCKELDLLVTYTEPYYTIQGMFDRPYTLFPLLSDDRLNEPIPFEGESEQQKAYRANAEVFNTTNFTPSVWSVTSMEIGMDRYTVEVKTKVGALSFKTRSVYTFVLSPKGEKELHFETKGDGMASWGLFTSPNPGENGVFVCKFIHEPRQLTQ